MFACIFAPHSPADAATQQLLLDGAYGFSPRVEDTAPRTVVFDATGLGSLFGSMEALAARILEQMQQAGLAVNVAIAANPDAAVTAARGFSGATIVATGDEGRRLAKLPLSTLEPPAEILETLERWGIHTLGGLAGLPPVQVSERLGQEGVRLHKLARGAHTRPLVPREDPPRFVECMDLDYAIPTIEPLAFVLNSLLETLCRRLSARSLATQEAFLTLGLERSPEPYRRTLRLPLPVRNPRVLAKLFVLALEAHPPGAAAVSVEMETIPIRPRPLQNGLFVPLSPDPEKLELTLARIAVVVGSGRVGSPEILDTRRPDAFRMKKYDVTLNRPFASAPSNVYRLALRFFRPRIAASIEMKNEAPAWIAFPHGHGPIAAASGPWRGSGDWWKTDGVWNREEWDIEALDSLYRIHRDVATGRWFVEGIYD
ncbi:MAG TPA: DNA polymerase Y family protein [Terriglobia bacterium]|nr:DNA polymerase Y family protein [Terriglobia bacterium]